MSIQRLECNATVQYWTILLLPLFLIGDVRCAPTEAPMLVQMPQALTIATVAAPGPAGSRLSDDCDAPDGAVQMVRELLPSEWGVPYPVGLAYSETHNQITLLGHRGRQTSGRDIELVIITPYEDLVIQVAVGFDVDDAINIAMDDTAGELLVLNNLSMEMARLAVNHVGLPLPNELVRSDIGDLGVVSASGMAVDAEEGHLLILDGATSKIFRADIDKGFELVARIDLAYLGRTTLRGIAVHPRNKHIYVADVAVKALYELTPTGGLVRRYDMAELNLIAMGGMGFGPSADLTDSAHVYHLFIADSRFVDSSHVIEKARFGAIYETAISPLRSAVCAATIKHLPRRR